MSVPVKIVGSGVLTPAGVSCEPLRAVLAGQSGLHGAIGGFKLSDYLSSVKTYVDRTSALALAACSLALRDCGWNAREDGGAPIGLSLGTCWGCLDSLKLFHDKAKASGPRLAPPLIFPHAYANAPNSLASIEFDLRGPNLCVSSGVVSGALALGHAVDALRLGRAERVLAGGVDSLSSALPSAVEDRLSEGAAVLALTRDGSSAQVLGLILGWGAAYDLDAAVRAALADAGRAQEDIAAVICHRSGGPRAFGRAKVVDLIDQIGDLMGAGGPVGVVAAMLLAPAGPALIVSSDPGGSAAALVVGPAT